MYILVYIYIAISFFISSFSSVLFFPINESTRGFFMDSIRPLLSSVIINKGTTSNKFDTHTSGEGRSTTAIRINI